MFKARKSKIAYHRTAMSQASNEAENSSLTAAQQFLDSIDADVDLSASEETTETGSEPKKPADAKEIMSFIDEWTSPTANEESTPVNKEEKKPTINVQNAKAAVQNDSSGWASWGTSLWTQASAAVKAGTNQINKVTQDSETAKLLEDRVKDLQSFVNKENIGKIGVYYTLLCIYAHQCVAKSPLALSHFQEASSATLH
jgi:hypothetical protein